MIFKDWTNTLDNVFRVAVSSSVPVLLLGETGTGKTNLAKLIHDQSDRKDKAFVSVNLASLYEGTLESELFGHEKGAFTGADQKRIGRLQLADQGTLFLDEIGDLSLKLQARLLEVLQSGKITPLGSNKEVALDVRVIAATHRDLSKMIKEGLFREDLYHRLSVIQVAVPSVVDCRLQFDEIVHSILDFLSVKNKKSVLKINEDFASILENYSWPGNFRELTNVLEYAVLSCKNNELCLSDLPEYFLKIQNAELFLSEKAETSEFNDEKPVEVSELLGVISLPIKTDFYQSIRSFEKQYFEAVLKRFRGKINLTAKKTGLSKTTLINRLKDYGIRREIFT